MSLRVTSDRQTIHDAAGLVGERHLPGARVVAHDEEGQTGPWVGREAESRSQPMSPAPRRAVTGSNSCPSACSFDQRRTVRRQPRTLGLFLTAIAVGGVAASLFSGTFTRFPAPAWPCLADPPPGAQR